MLALDDCSTSYSAASVVNGTSWNSASFGLAGPEYDLFGTNVMCPSALNDFSFHGPSTTPQIGDVAYVLSARDWAFR